MSAESDVACIKIQEEELRFHNFSEADSFQLGSLMRERALARKLPLVIDIRIGIRPLFYAALPGTTPENPDWVRRKVNTVYRFEASSYRVALEYSLRGANFDASRGLDLLTYAPAGGGFPIRFGNTVVGAVTVSGIPQRDDHGFVVECLCNFLNKPLEKLALPLEIK